MLNCNSLFSGIFFFRIPLCQFFFGFGFDLGIFGALQKAFADGKYAISTKSYFFPYSHLSYPNSLSFPLFLLLCFCITVATPHFMCLCNIMNGLHPALVTLNSVE